MGPRPDRRHVGGTCTFTSAPPAAAPPPAPDPRCRIPMHSLYEHLLSACCMYINRSWPPTPACHLPFFPTHAFPYICPRRANPVQDPGHVRPYPLHSPPPQD